MDNTSNNNSNSIEKEDNSKFQTFNEKQEKSSVEEIFFAILRRKKILFISIIFFAILGFIRTTREKIFNPIYEGSFSLLISDPINQKSKSQAIGAASLFEGLADNQFQQDTPTLRKLLRSEYILKDISEEFNVDIGELSERIRIEQDLKVNGVLDVFLTSKNPVEDQKLLERMSEIYVNYANKQRQKKLADGLNFLSEQEPAIRQRNIALRNQLELFRAKNNLIDPVTESRSKKRDIITTENTIVALNKKIKRLKTIREDVKRGKLGTRGYYESVGDVGDASLEIRDPDRELIRQYENLNGDLAIALLTYTPDSYVVKNIQSRLREIKPRVQRLQIKTIDRAIESTVNIIDLNKLALEDYNNEFQNIPSLVTEFTALSFDLKAANNNLSGLNAVKEKLQLELAQDSQPWTVIRNPRFGAVRIYPSYKKELTNSILIGAIAGVALSLLREKFDYVYHSPDDIRDSLNYPFLGHLPYVEFFSNVREEEQSILEELSFTNNEKNEKINAYERFFYQESLRNIYTSIRFLNSDKPVKVITVTSSVPKEGKSMINILLAKTLCEMDLKVLQIDADLRKPQLHFRLGLNNITGLSNLLTNKEISISEIKQVVPGYKNWEVITSGTKPPDPTRLLNSERMENFIKEIRKGDEYDLVIIDTPPVIGLADSLLVAEKSDGLILIVSTNEVQRNLPKESINRSLTSGAYFLGMISNSVKKPVSKMFKYGGYAANYGYNSYSQDPNSIYAHYANNNDREEEMEIDDISEEENIKSDVKKIYKEFLENYRSIVQKLFKWLDK